MENIPAEHTAAILKDNEVIYSGMVKDSKVKWDNLPFEGIHGIFQYALKAIDNKWYRYTWMQF